jgi:transcriptional regulator with XRE-family HTH domain
VAEEQETRSEFLQAFGMRIKLLRTKRRMSQEDLGVAVGMHRTFVGILERGQRGVNVEALPRLAAGLGITLVEFFDDERAAD